MLYGSGTAQISIFDRAARSGAVAHMDVQRLTMAQFDTSARAFGKKGSMAQRLIAVHQAIYLIALAALFWSTASTAQGVPASCPNTLATADIIDHDSSVSFCELCDVSTLRLEIAAVLDDSSANSPSTQFVNTAKRDFGTYEIATQ